MKLLIAIIFLACSCANVQADVDKCTPEKQNQMQEQCGDNIDRVQLERLAADTDAYCRKVQEYLFCFSSQGECFCNDKGLHGFAQLKADLQEGGVKCELTCGATRDAVEETAAGVAEESTGAAAQTLSGDTDGDKNSSNCASVSPSLGFALVIFVVPMMIPGRV